MTDTHDDTDHHSYDGSKDHLKDDLSLAAAEDTAEESSSPRWYEKVTDFLSDIPSSLSRTTLDRVRPSIPSLRSSKPSTPLGARTVTSGYVDDLWQARPTLDRPYPVVLLHGTISSKLVWQNLVLLLRNEGFVVFAPDYGVHGTQDIPTSAMDVSAYIEQVLAATGAPAVDIVGHSQGGLLARYWINELGGEDYVHHLITLGSPHKGTTILGMLGNLVTSDLSRAMATGAIDKIFGVAGMQQVVGSPLLETLASSEDTRPDILYTCLATDHDSTVVPRDHAFLEEGPDSSVRNYYVQEAGIARVRHEELPMNPQVHELVLHALYEGLEGAHSSAWLEPGWILSSSSEESKDNSHKDGNEGK